MSQEQNYNDQEIDLARLKAKISNSMDGMNRSLYRMLQFFVRNAIAIIICIILGVGLGLYLDKTQKTYDNKIVVIPNFGSVDYLYNKIDLLEAKIKEKDTAFFRNIGIKNPKKLAEITIEPIVDIYSLVNKTEPNLELVRLMSADSDMKKIVEDPVTSKNYTYHVINFTTDMRVSRKDLIDPLLKYLNESDYFSKLQVEYINNFKMKMQSNEQTIEQINGILNQLGDSGSAKSSNQVYINQNTQLNDVIKTKDELVRELGNLRVELISNSSIIRESGMLLNEKNTKAVNGKLKFVLPLLFIFLFIVGKLFFNFYKSQKLKAAVA